MSHNHQTCLVQITIDEFNIAIHLILTLYYAYSLYTCKWTISLFAVSDWRPLPKKFLYVLPASSSLEVVVLFMLKSSLIGLRERTFCIIRWCIVESLQVYMLKTCFSIAPFMLCITTSIRESEEIAFISFSSGPMLSLVLFIYCSSVDVTYLVF